MRAVEINRPRRDSGPVKKRRVVAANYLDKSHLYEMIEQYLLIEDSISVTKSPSGRASAMPKVDFESTADCEVALVRMSDPDALSHM